MKYLFYILIAIPNLLLAQDYQMRWTDPKPNDKTILYPIVANSHGIYTVSTSEKDELKKTIVTHVKTNLEPIKSVNTNTWNAKWLSNYNIIQPIASSQGLYLLLYQKEKIGKIIYKTPSILALDTNLTPISSPISISKSEPALRFEIEDDIYIQQSRNQKWTAIYSLYIEGASVWLHLNMLDSQMKTSWTTRMIISSQPDKFLAGYSLVSNRGDLLMLNALRPDIDPKKPLNVNYAYTLSIINDQSTEPTIIDHLQLSPHNIHDIGIKSLEHSGDVILYAWYQQADSGDPITGIVQASIDLSKAKLQNINIIPLKDNKKLLYSPPAKKEKPISPRSFGIQNVFRQSDGSWIYVVDEYRSWYNTEKDGKRVKVNSYFEFGDIINLHVNDLANIYHAERTKRKILTHQVNTDPMEYSSVRLSDRFGQQISYSAMIDDKLVLLYNAIDAENNNKKNEVKEEKSENETSSKPEDTKKSSKEKEKDAKEVKKLKEKEEKEKKKASNSQKTKSSETPTDLSQSKLIVKVIDKNLKVHQNELTGSSSLDGITNVGQIYQLTPHLLYLKAERGKTVKNALISWKPNANFTPYTPPQDTTSATTKPKESVMYRSSSVSTGRIASPEEQDFFDKLRKQASQSKPEEE